jgi:hypothetical protein
VQEEVPQEPQQEAVPEVQEEREFAAGLARLGRPQFDHSGFD